VNSETLLGASTNDGLEKIRLANESFENVAELKYLGTKITQKNQIHDEIKSRLNSWDACCYSVQNHLSSRLV
jgi:hypothetical protein